MGCLKLNVSLHSHPPDLLGCRGIFYLPCVNSRHKGPRFWVSSERLFTYLYKTYWSYCYVSISVSYIFTSRMALLWFRYFVVPHIIDEVPAVITIQFHTVVMRHHRDLSYQIMSCHVMSCHVTSSHVKSRYITSHHITPYHNITYIISYIMSCHVMSMTDFASHKCSKLL